MFNILLSCSSEGVEEKSAEDIEKVKRQQEIALAEAALAKIRFEFLFFFLKIYISHNFFIKQLKSSIN